MAHVWPSSHGTFLAAIAHGSNYDGSARVDLPPQRCSHDELWRDASFPVAASLVMRTRDHSYYRLVIAQVLSQR